MQCTKSTSLPKYRMKTWYAQHRGHVSHVSPKKIYRVGENLRKLRQKKILLVFFETRVHKPLSSQQTLTLHRSSSLWSWAGLPERRWEIQSCTHQLPAHSNTSIQAQPSSSDGSPLKPQLNTATHCEKLCLMKERSFPAVFDDFIVIKSAIYLEFIN